MSSTTRETLQQYARVVEEIQSALQGGAELDWNLLHEVAAEYAAACDAVNERLRQCKALLQQGLRSEALQEAEREPPLLEACATLDFPELAQWRAALVHAQMPLPLPLQMDLAAELNAAYAAQTPLEGLLRRLRLLALLRAPLRLRIDVLAQLAAADRDSPVWMQDLKELELARQQEIRSELSAAIARRDLPSVQSLVAELEAGPWRFPPPAAVVAQAQAARAKLTMQLARERLEEIAQRLEAAYCALDEAAGRAAADEWEETSRLAQLPADAPLRTRVAPALQWVAELRAREHEQQALAEAVAALSAALEHRAGRAQLEALSTRVRQLHGAEDPQVARLLQRCTQQLEALRRAARRRFALVATAGGLTLGVAVFLLARSAQLRWQQATARLEAQTLARLIQQQQWEAAAAHLEALQRQRPAIWAQAVVQQQATLLRREQQADEERRATFARLMASVEQAEPQHADRRLLLEAEALAQSPAEHERIARARARFEEYDRQQQQLRQRQFDEELAALLAATEEMERRVAAGDLVDRADLSRLRSKLEALEARMGMATLGVAQRDQLRTLLARLTAVGTQNDQLKSRQDAMARLTRAVGDPQRYVQALRELVEEHPTLPGAPQMRRVAHEEAGWWMEVEAWRGALRDPAWGQLGTLSSLQALRLLATVQPLLGPQPAVPPGRWVLSKVPVLHAVAQREDEQGQPRSRQLAALLKAPWMRDLWALKTDSRRTYYLTDRNQVEMNDATGLLTIEYVFDLRLRTKKITRSERIQSLRPAPQAALAQQLELHALPRLREGTWESGLWAWIEQVLDHEEVDPILRYLLLVEVTELGGQTSFSFQQALQPLKQMLDDAPVDRTASWLVPDDPTAERAREHARRLLQALQDRRTAWRQALQEAVQVHHIPLPPLPQWVGWLSAEEGAGPPTYRCHTPQNLLEDGRLMVLAPAPQPSAEGEELREAEWFEVAQVRQGQVSWNALARGHLQAGRPVYWLAEAVATASLVPRP